MNILLLDKRAFRKLLRLVRENRGIQDEEIVELVCRDRNYYDEVAGILKELGYELDEAEQLWKRIDYDERGRKEPT